jgi:hypothetical protein
VDARAAIERILEYVTRDRLYLRTFEATVERQASDGTLDLLPDDERIRGTGLQGVPIYHGLPGVTVTVVPGARVLLQFVAGDPTRPFASLWRSGDIEEISFNGGQAPVARQGDPVAVYWPVVSVSGTAGGVQVAGVLAIGNQSAGIIQSGAARVKA